MQHIKDYQDHLTLAFTNPAYALLLYLFPWHPKAKRAKRSIAEIKKVIFFYTPAETHMCMYIRLC